MKPPTISLTALLERIEGELHVPEGRTVRVCRDASGKCWVVDRAERVVPLREFTARSGAAAQTYLDRARAEDLLRLAAVVTGAFGRASQRLQRICARLSAGRSTHPV